MALKDDINAEVTKILKDSWTEREGTVVPESTDLRLSNDAVWLDATILYADLADSTVLVDSHSAKFSGEIYKCFLHAAAKIIKSESGAITAYDGDRIMAVYIGDSKNTSAVRTALKINYARVEVINPAIAAQYPAKGFVLNSVVGIDTCRVLVARTGVRGANDLVWVGRAANHAAKLAAFDHAYPTWISDSVHDNMHESAKTTNGKSMWEKRIWTAKTRTVYCSNWKWRIE